MNMNHNIMVVMRVNMNSDAVIIHCATCMMMMMMMMILKNSYAPVGASAIKQISQSPSTPSWKQHGNPAKGGCKMIVRTLL